MTQTPHHMPEGSMTMFNRKLFGALLMIATTTLAPMVAVASPSARPTTSTNCLLKAHRATFVAPYFEEERQGSASTVQRLRGASFFVEAKPGLTAEWLLLTLRRHIVEMRTGGAMPDCPLDVKDVTITVESAGPGFFVKIIARDADKADEVLRRAQLLFG